MFRHYGGVWSHNQKYSELFGYSEIFGNIRNPCIYNRAIFRTLAYLEPKASSKACRTCKMIMHIQSPGIVRTIYSSIFKDIYAYSEILILRYIFSHIHRRSVNGERGGLPCPFLKIKKSVLILERKALVLSIFGLNFSLNM